MLELSPRQIELHLCDLKGMMASSHSFMISYFSRLLGVFGYLLKESVEVFNIFCGSYRVFFVVVVNCWYFCEIMRFDN